MTSSLQPGRRLSFWALECLEDRSNPANAGTLDPAFGVSGIASAPFPNYTGFTPISTIFAEAVQPNGDLLVAGRCDSPIPTFFSNFDFGIARFNPNGSLDTTFGNNGLVRIPFDLDNPLASQFNDNNDNAHGIAVLPGGQIIVAGFADLDPFNRDIALVELNANGSVDTSFGTKGYVTKNVTNQFINANYVSGVAVQSNGKIVVVGTGSTPGGTGIEVVRFNSNGTLDGSFNGTGYNVFSASGGSDTGNGIAIQSNGQIDIVATLGESGGNDLGVVQLNSNGSINGSFGTNGVFAAGFSATGGASGTAISVEANGQIIADGLANQSGGTQIAVVDLNPDGKYNQAFGFNAGRTLLSFSAGAISNDNNAPDNVSVAGLATEADGEIVATATVGLSNGDTGFGAVRLTPTGVVDPTFGTNGYTVVDVGKETSVFFPEFANVIVIGTNGEFLIGGEGSTGMVVVGLVGDEAAGTSPPVTSPGPLGYGGGLLGVSTDGAQLTAYGVDPSTLEYNSSAPVNVSLANAFPGYTGPVRVAVADVNGDGVPDFVVVTGPGTPTKFCVISGTDQASYVIPPTTAFPGSSSFTGGAFVTTGEFGMGEGADIVITPDQGGGPRVVIFADVNGAATQEANFYGITDPNFRGGARAAVGDINGDGIPDLVVSAGYGGGPRIAVFNGADLFTTHAKLINDFYAFSPLLNNGAYVAVGDVNGDGYADLIFGAGEGGAPQVLVISGQTLITEGARVAIANPLANFYMNGDTTSRGGARVAVKNVIGSNALAIVAASGAGDPASVNVYLGESLGVQGEPDIYQTLTPFGGATLTDGVYVG